MPNTPLGLVIFIMMLISLIIFMIGYEKRARLAEILFPVIFLPLLVLLVFLFKEINISDALPIFTTPIKGLLWQSYLCLCIYSGLDSVYIINLYLNEKKGVFKSLVKSIVKIGVLYSIIFMFLITVLTSGEISHHLWPITQLIKVISIPGILMERQELLFVIFWINSMFFTFSNYIFTQNILIEKVFKRKRSYILAAVLCAVVCVISLIPRNIEQVYKYVNMLNINVNYITLFILPVTIYIVARIRKIGVEVEN